MRYVTDMNYTFSGCKSLKPLLDILKWETQNVKDMNYIFSGCRSLKSLPDTFKWDTKNV